MRKWLLLLLLPAQLIWAETRADCDRGFSAEVEGLPISGQGEAHYLLFHLYDAALYHDGGELDDESGAAVCLEICYRRDFSAAQLTEAAEQQLGKQHPNGLPAELHGKVDALHLAYRDVRENDRYRLCHLPGSGTRLELNQRGLATIEGEDFARVYFGIWLASPPLSPQLRDQLLGRRAQTDGVVATRGVDHIPRATLPTIIRTRDDRG
jgi:hypothetical protein